MNRITVMGRLGHSPETKDLSGGGKVTNFNLASSFYQKGEEKTVWYRVALFGDAHDGIVKHLDKGSAVVVIGELQPREYTKKDGTQAVSFDIKAVDLAFAPFKQKREDTCNDSPF